jgi:hypothetical protein
MPRKPTEPATEPSPAPIMEAVMSYVGRHGKFAAGQQLRADHPAVQGNVEFWAPQADPAAKAVALLSINETVDAAAAASSGNRDDSFTQPAGFAIALRPVTQVIEGPDGAPRSRTIERGERVHADDEIVAEHPTYFDVTP